MEITIALAQMAIALGRPQENLQMAQNLATQAAAQGANLLLLPELWATGYDLARTSEYAAALDSGHFALMASLAQANRVYVAGTALEANPDGKPFNTAALYGPDGRCLGAYRKVHLWAPLGEVEHLTPGDTMPAFDLPWGRVAMAICYDLRFPELWRRLADAGAQLVLIPAEWPVHRVEHWRLLLRARAVENQLYVAGCNRAGADDDGEFGGHSAMVDPWARVLIEGGSESGLLVTKIEMDEVVRARRIFPFLGDRRPEVYSRQGARNHVRA
jgi:predicted amidohydrolase